MTLYHLSWGVPSQAVAQACCKWGVSILTGLRLGGSADLPGAGGAQAGQLLWPAPIACNRAPHVAFPKALLFLSCVSALAHQAALRCSYPDRSHSSYTFHFSIDSPWRPLPDQLEDMVPPTPTGSAGWLFQQEPRVSEVPWRDCVVLGGTPGPSAGHMVCACSVAKSCPTLYTWRLINIWGGSAGEKREKAGMGGGRKGDRGRKCVLRFSFGHLYGISSSELKFIIWQLPYL